MLVYMEKNMWLLTSTLQWRHNGRNSVSNHQPHDCLLNRLFRRRTKKSSASLAFVRVIHRGPVNSPHKWPVTRKMLPLDDVIMYYKSCENIIFCYTPYHEPVYTGWSSVHWDTTGPPSEYLQGTLKHHWKNLVETAPHCNATWET